MDATRRLDSDGASCAGGRALGVGGLNSGECSHSSSGGAGTESLHCVCQGALARRRRTSAIRANAIIGAALAQRSAETFLLGSIMGGQAMTRRHGINPDHQQMYPRLVTVFQFFPVTAADKVIPRAGYVTDHFRRQRHYLLSSDGSSCHGPIACLLRRHPPHTHQSASLRADQPLR